MFSRRHVKACDRCGVEVWLARTVNGRWQPIDFPPEGQREDPDGNVSVWQDEHGVLQVRALPPGMEAPYWQRRLMPHAATCGKKAEVPAPRPAGNVVPFPSRAELRRRRGRGGVARHATRRLPAVP